VEQPTGALGSPDGHERGECACCQARARCCTTVAPAINMPVDCRPPARWPPSRQAGSPAMKVRSPRTLLQALMSERHLTREHAVEALDRRARDMWVRGFGFSIMQL